MCVFAGAKNVCFCTIGDFGSPTKGYQQMINLQRLSADDKRSCLQRKSYCKFGKFRENFILAISVKAAYSVTMNIFRKILFSFQIICKS